MVEPYLTGVECFFSIQLGRSLFNWDLTPLLLKQGPLFICPGPIRQLNFLRASPFPEMSYIRKFHLATPPLIVELFRLLSAFLIKLQIQQAF